MIGPIIVFVVVCGIVAVYMSIVHWFLRTSEQGVIDETPTAAVAPSAAPPYEPIVREIQRAPREQWAH